MAWNSRFKAASVGKRNLKSGDHLGSGRRVEDHVLNLVRRISPEVFLRRHYPDVKATQNGETVWVPKVLRADLDGDHWVSCDWENSGIGDNVALALFVVPGLSFPDAIAEFIGAQSVLALRKPLLVKPKSEVFYPKLPPVADQDRGRAYLYGRGLSEGSILAAEESGLLRYSSSGVIFLGRDHESLNRSVRAATLRYFEPTNWQGDLLTKRDLANTDKLYPGVLPGDPARVLVIESGISGLAARDIVVRQRNMGPSLIVTGGVNARRWLSQNEPVRRILVEAEVVEIWGENEGTSEKQSRTDLLRVKLQCAIAEQRQGELPFIIYPPFGIKDAADWNLRLIRSVVKDIVIIPGR